MTTIKNFMLFFIGMGLITFALSFASISILYAITNTLHPPINVLAVSVGAGVGGGIVNGVRAAIELRE